MLIYKTFLKQTFLFFLIIFIFYGLSIYFFYRTPISTIWIYNALEKKIKNANQLSQKKVILLSGSNTHYGIISKKIEESFNIPCFNLGSHAGLGIDYIFNYSKKVLKSGDIVIAPIEYEHFFWDDSVVNETKRDYLFSWDKEYLNNLSLIDIFKNVYSISPIYFLKSIYQYNLPEKEKNVGDGANSTTIDENGDETEMHYQKIKYEFEDIDFKQNFEKSKGFQIIISYIEWCKKNNIKLYFTYPNRIITPPNKQYKYSKSFEYFNGILKIHNINLIGNEKDAFFENQYMYDSKYHLNSLGRELRTKRIIELIKQNGILNEK